MLIFLLITILIINAQYIIFGIYNNYITFNFRKSHHKNLIFFFFVLCDNTINCQFTDSRQYFSIESVFLHFLTI